MKSIKYILCLSMVLPVTAWSWQWMDLWQTRDQQGSKLLQTGHAEAAAQIFQNKNWQSVANYRSGNYGQAFKQFTSNNDSDGQYNAGNSAAFMGNYQQAITAYDKAIQLNPKNEDAVTNREIIKKLLQKQQQQQSKQDQKNNKNNKSQQPQNQSAANDKNDKSAEKQNNSQQNNSQQNFQQNSSKQQQADKQNQSDKQNTQDQQQAQQNSSTDNKQQQAANNDKQKQDAQQQQSNEKQPSRAQAARSSKQQRQDENNKQLLRRLSDDASGLLQQKFLRDYARRHSGQMMLDEGIN